MANTKNKITYGVCNVHVWAITSTDESGTPTYGEPFAMPGCTEVSIDPEGSSDPFYADDTIYYTGVSNTGYSGSITVADIPDEFLTQVMKEVKSTNSTYFENAGVEPAEFAIAFEFKGDQKKRRHLFYRCKATRPSVASQTKEDKISPNTQQLSLTAMPRLDNQIVKARCEEGDKDYANWYTTPVAFTDVSLASAKA